MVEMVRKGEPILIEDYDKFSDDRNFTYRVNEAKKEYKRSPEYKATLIPRRKEIVQKHNSDVIDDLQQDFYDSIQE